jgi:3-deoxy-D-manno-octulosonate 8-phosphate phosphatase (KDO 8-P phosphatase)
MIDSLLTPDLLTIFAQVKLLALDVDGVLTDGGLYYTESGEELKKFNVKDGLGLKQVIQAGIEVAFITTSSSSATLQRARKLGVSHVFLSVENKLEILQDLCQTLQIDLKQVAYVGDDLVDLKTLYAVGLPLTVSDAMLDNIKAAAYVTRLGGGQGAVREICDLLLISHESHDQG